MADRTHNKTENSRNGRYSYRINQISFLNDKIIYPADIERLTNFSHLLKDDVKYLYINMSDYTDLLYVKNKLIDTIVKPFLNNNNIQTVILDCSYDPFNQFESTIETWDWPCEYNVLVNDFSYIFKESKNIIYHNPFIWQYKELRYKKYDNERIYPISCLNGVPRKHRIDLFNLLRNSKNFNKILFSIGNFKSSKYINDINPDTDRNTYKRYFKEFGDKGFSNFTPIEDNYDRGSDHSIKNIAFRQTVLNVVTETAPDNARIFTEKTWKPIYARQFFIQFNRPFAVEHLRKIGIDVFDDVIDHSYDQVIDYQSRLTMISQEILRLLDNTANLFDKHNEYKDRLEKNFDRLTSEDFLQ